jgi:hypothetical protein
MLTYFLILVEIGIITIILSSGKFSDRKRVSTVSMCLVVAIGFLFVSIPGPVDPGENLFEDEFNESVSFEFIVLNSSWFTNQIEIICSYEHSYGEVVYCYLDFYSFGSKAASIDLTIQAKQGPRRIFSDKGIVELESGSYNVIFSYECTELELRWINVLMNQIRKDGRNNDQKIWDSFKIIILASLLVVVCVVYLKESQVNIVHHG